MVSARLQPAGKQAVRIDPCILVVADAMRGQHRLQPTALEGIHGVGAATDVFTADEHLWNGRTADALEKHGTDLSAAVVGLVGRGVEVYGSIGDRSLREQLAQRPAELAPLEPEKYEWLRGISKDMCDEVFDVCRNRRSRGCWFRLRRHGADSRRGGRRI